MSSIDTMDAAIKLAELAMDVAMGARIYDEESREEMGTYAAVVLGLKWAEVTE